MKYKFWLTFYGYPALAVILFLSLLGWLFILLANQTAPRGPLARTAVIHYIPRNDTATIKSKETEIRAVYASDLFASERNNRFSAMISATNRSIQPQLPITLDTSIFLPLPQANSGAERTTNDISGYFLDINDIGAHAPRRSPGRTTDPANNPAALSIVLKGNLKYFSIEPDIFQEIPLTTKTEPSRCKTWTIQANVSVNDDGSIGHVLAESRDCGPEPYREIIKRLYQYRFPNVHKACRGKIIISYPAHRKQPE